jgi:DNA polymerase III epsilon subunit family exonuclease
MPRRSPKKTGKKKSRKAKAAPAPGVFVAIDLETTGLDASTCEIIEFGAVRFRGGAPVERFESLARSPAPLPEAITRLTGISDADLAGAPESGHALAEFLEFIGEDPLVAHNASFESGFLRAATAARFSAGIFDSLELARILMPDCPGHSLGRLADELGLEHGRLHRAAADAELGGHLWAALLARLGKLPLPVLSEVCWMLGPTIHPLRELFMNAERAAVKNLDGEPEYASLFKAAKAGPREFPEPGDPPEMDPDALAAALSETGAVAAALPDYEPRPQQEQMCRKVAEALADGRHLVVEAGTGVGKSLAYLLPAAAWSESGARKIVISTNTKNLQSQLFDKDIPLLEKALDHPLGAALLKGRRNYLCLRKLLYLLREAGSELDDLQRCALVPVLVWAPRTETGDVSECSPLFLPEARGLLDKLTTDGPDCMGRACPQRRKCFLWAARARAREAGIIVVNHSLVFAELGQSLVLPPYAEVVFDEAHNLEGTATRHMSIHIWPGRFYRLLNRLFKFRRGGRGRRRRGGPSEMAGTGLLPSLFEQVGRARGKAAEGFLDQLEDEAGESSTGVVTCIDALSTFSAALAGLWAGTRYRDKLRYSADSRRADLWSPVFAAQKGLVAALSALYTRLERISQALLESPDAGKLPRAAELSSDIAGAVEGLRALVEDIEFTAVADDDRYVYWAELGGRRGDQPELWAAPLEVAPMLAEKVFGQKRCCVLCSATMTVARRFDYLTSRLGLDLLQRVQGSGSGVPEEESDHLPEARDPEPGTRPVETLLLGTPFDFVSQSRVLVPGWLPEPGNAESGRNSSELARMLAALFPATRGRAMVLFTSYGALDEVYRDLKPDLEAKGLRVLAQGRDGSRESLLAALHEEENVVLLATSSFWEGVDVRGSALSCLVLARLPFQVWTEPLFKARSELVESRGMSSFMNYSVPEAVLRFRQGFGRLIRSKTDRGIAVLADRRLVSKRYGRAFLASLPRKWQVVSNSDQLVAAAEEFFGA